MRQDGHPRLGFGSLSVAACALALIIPLTILRNATAPERITFNLSPGAMPYPLCLLKLEGSDYAAPTYFVGRGDTGDLTIDLRRSGRSAGRGAFRITHLEQNDPSLLPQLIGSDWTKRDDSPAITLRLERVEESTLLEEDGEPHGTITLRLRLEGLENDVFLTLAGTYDIEENGLALRSGSRVQGDVLTIEVSDSIPAIALGLHRPIESDRTDPPAPIDITVWFQAAESNTR